MADFPLTPEQTSALVSKGALSPETASRIPQPAAPIPEPVAEPVVQPVVEPQPVDMGLESVIAEGQQESEDMAAAAKAEALREKELRAAQMREELEKKVKRSLGEKDTRTGGFLGQSAESLAEGRSLSADEARARYSDEFQQLQQLEEQIAGEKESIGLVSSPAETEGYMRNADMQEGDEPQPMLAQAPAYDPMASFDAVKAAYNDKIDAIKQTANVAEEQAVYEQNLIKKRAEEENTTFAQKQADIERNIQKANEAIQTLTEKSAELEQRKVDPERYWNNKSTGQKVLAAIGLALGAIGSRNGQNQAANIIMRQMEQDLQLQKAEIDQGQLAFNRQRGVYKDMLSAYGDSQAALNASRAAYLKGIEIDVAAMAARTRGKEARAKANLLTSDINLKRVEAENKLKNDAIRLAALRSGQINPMMLDEKQQEKYVQGMGLAFDKESAKLMRETAATTGYAVTQIKKLIDIGDRPVKSLSLNDRKEAQTLSAMLKGMLRKEIVGPGAVSESEWKLLNSIIADPTKVFSLDSSNRVALKTLGQSLQKNLASKAKVYIMAPQGRSAGRQIRSRPRDEYKKQMIKAKANAK